ncbi:SDR family NAD(P)-dependent oxidoreductase [Alphaproteobacteria bacterium]|nr:SDR family NAD(P)-dependent oxidoreductase [Alphaproteobacteria bacterium]
MEYANNTNINKLFSFSRNGNGPNHELIIKKKVDYLDEKSLEDASKVIDVKLDLIIVAIGMLDNPEKSIRDISKEKFFKMFEANTIPTALIGKYFIPTFYKDRTTKFASLSARVGSIDDNELGGWYSYRASKTALNMILKNFSIEQKRVNPQNIIIGLHPGTVDSVLSKPFQKKNKEYFSPEFAAKKLREVIENKSISDNGKIFDWDNKVIPS